MVVGSSLAAEGITARRRNSRPEQTLAFMQSPCTDDNYTSQNSCLSAYIRGPNQLGCGKVSSPLASSGFGISEESCIAFSPKSCNSAASSSGAGFGVVSSFSPVKMELAPAKNQRKTAD